MHVPENNKLIHGSSRFSLIKAGLQAPFTYTDLIVDEGMNKYM